MVLEALGVAREEAVKRHMPGPDIVGNVSARASHTCESQPSEPGWRDQDTDPWWPLGLSLFSLV